MRRYSLAFVLVVAGCAGPATGDTTTTTAEPVVTTITAPPPPATTTTTVAVTTTVAPSTTTTTDPEQFTIEAFAVPAGSRPHDVAPAADGGVWYTAQNLGELGWLDPETGETRHIDLGDGSRPHGVIVADDGTPWITDGGLNSIVSVDPATDEVTVYPLPDTSADANLNTAVFDLDGDLWFTGQAGVYGVLDVDDTGEMVVYESPDGRGPYGMTLTPDGTVFYASLAGSFVGEVAEDGSTIVHEPPTPNQGARRVWSDSAGAVWVSEWNTGNVSRYDPTSGEWDTWELPGNAATYAVYVDEEDIVWLSDFGANAMVRFDPQTESFTYYELPHDPGDVRQILGRRGEVWGAESAADQLILIRIR
jgi:virginiamycin B lyase